VNIIQKTYLQKSTDELWQTMLSRIKIENRKIEIRVRVEHVLSYIHFLRTTATDDIIPSSDVIAAVNMNRSTARRSTTTSTTITKYFTITTLAIPSHLCVVGSSCHFVHHTHSPQQFPPSKSISRPRGVL